MIECGKLAVLKLFKVSCYVCGKVVKLEGTTIQEAKADARKEWDWSLGRDKRWRCDRCRPRRFGERR